jgi:hypothetical protein
MIAHADARQDDPRDQDHSPASRQIEGITHGDSHDGHLRSQLSEQLDWLLYEVSELVADANHMVRLVRRVDGPAPQAQPSAARAVQPPRKLGHLTVDRLQLPVERCRDMGP